MIRTHNAVVSERDRAMQVLARMKALEAKRKKEMQTVMINSRTIISATKTALKEKMAQMRNSSFKPSSDTPVKESIESNDWNNSGLFSEMLIRCYIVS